MAETMRALFVLCMVWLGMHLHSVKKEGVFSHRTVVIDAGKLYGPWCWKLIVPVEKGHLINTSKICALQNTATWLSLYLLNLAGRRGWANISGSSGPSQSTAAFRKYKLLCDTSQKHSVVLIMPFVSGLQI